MGTACNASAGAGLAACKHSYPQRGPQEAGVSFCQFHTKITAQTVAILCYHKNFFIGKTALHE
jgi:hypothetical protein